jgi:outer membrane biosynthesis protein TonB
MPGATVPLGQAEGEGRAVEGGAAEDAAPWIPTDEAIARPPKVARPFSAGLPPPGRKRVLMLAVATGVLVAGLAGTAVALGATGLGRNNEAGAETPIVTTTTQTPPPAPPPQEQPARRKAPAPANPPPAQRQREAPKPPAVVPTTEQPPETTEEPPTTEPTTTDPTTTTTTPRPIDPGDGTGGGEEGTESEGGGNANREAGPDDANS